MKTLFSIKSLFFVVLLVNMAFTTSLGANTKAKKQSIFDSFYQKEILNIQIKTDLKQLIANKKTNNKQTAQISFEDNKGQKQLWDIQIKARGKYRRRVCDFPPIKIYFPKQGLKLRGYKKFNDYKIVTHCYEGVGSNENVLKEYLTYELYRELTDKSFRTQLVKITYVDANTKDKLTRFGIIIEDTDELAKRFKSQINDTVYNMASHKFQKDNLQIHNVFQYMIGNTDWAIATMKNLKILQPKNGQKCLVIPYDFDFSGLVNTPYSFPDKSIGLTKKGQRKFLGSVPSQEEFNATITHFQSKKDKLIEMVKQFHVLRKKDRKGMIRYIESFYKEVASNDFLASI